MATELKNLREEKVVWIKEKGRHIEVAEEAEKLKREIAQLKVGNEKLEAKVALQGQAIGKYAQAAEACKPIVLDAIASKREYELRNKFGNGPLVKEQIALGALREYNKLFQVSEVEL